MTIYSSGQLIILQQVDTGQLFKPQNFIMLFHTIYLEVGDADITLYEAILFCGLENRHSELSILLHPLDVISRPVLVAHLL